MENTEASISSTATRTWQDFLERMRQPSATEFVRNIKSFIVSLTNNASDPDRDSASIQEFFSNMEANFRAHPLWAGRTEEELDSAGEGLEKYIMTKIFNRVFASHPDDVKVDNEFNKKSGLIQQFIQPEHLEIQPIYQNEISLLEAQKELLKINTYKAPRDKLACILSCCKVISNLLFNASVSADENPPGADDFLPVLIYVIIKANPPQFHSNLMYIQRYRNKARLVGEASYVFTNMLSAESFILDIDAKALSMDETEFVKNMESAQTLMSGLAEDYNMQSQSGQSQSVSESKIKEVPSVSDLENKGATMLVMEEKVSEKFNNFPYLYSKAGDLTVSDVEGLLNGYKQLVFKYVCLAKGLGSQVNQISDEPKDFGRIENVGEGLGVSSPKPGTEIRGGTAEALQGKGSIDVVARIEGDVKGSGVMVAVPPLESSETRIRKDDAPERDVEVDDLKVKGSRNDDAGASTPEATVAGEQVTKIEEMLSKG